MQIGLWCFEKAIVLTLLLQGLLLVGAFSTHWPWLQKAAAPIDLILAAIALISSTGMGIAGSIAAVRAKRLRNPHKLVCVVAVWVLTWIQFSITCSHLIRTP